VTPPTPGPGAPGGAETSAVRAEETADTAAALTDEENPDDAAVPSPRAAQAGQLNRERNQNMVGASETAEEGNKAAGAGEPKGQAKGRANAAAHRSAVASFVQSLNNIADREPGGIGEQVRAIAQEQNQAGEKVALAMEKVQNRNRFRTLLFGTDYKNTGAVRSEMVKTRNRIEKLNRIAADMEEGMDKTVLLEEAAALEAEQAKINEFIAANENKFSLFGWAVKLFAN
jgi:predicted transcriptional regulator